MGPVFAVIEWMKTDSYSARVAPVHSSEIVRVPAGAEERWIDGLLSDHHYLGAGRSVGDYLRQVVAVAGKPAALLVWGPGCYALKDRDLWISWSATQRLERLKIVLRSQRTVQQTGASTTESRYYLSSAQPQDYLPAQWRGLIGGHWGGVEIRNHCRRDVLESVLKIQNAPIFLGIRLDWPAKKRMKMK